MVVIMQGGWVWLDLPIDWQLMESNVVEKWDMFSLKGFSIVCENGYFFLMRKGNIGAVAILCYTITKCV